MNVLALFDPPSIGSDPRYREAEAFQENVEAEEGVDYEWVCNYGKESFDRGLKLNKDLDDKANDIIKYLGGGTGLFTLGVLANVTPANVQVILWAVPAFLLALISICYAVLARQPNPITHPPSVEGAYKYASHYRDGDGAKVAFIGQWHLTCVGVDIANEVKAERVKAATWCFFFAIVFLSLPLGAAALTMRAPKPSTAKTAAGASAQTLNLGPSDCLSQSSV